MIGAAVLVSRGILPESALELSLLAPYFINFPLAPAEGLILVNAGFERNVNGENIRIYPSSEKNTGTSKVSDNNSISLMTQEEFNISEQFKEAEIYAKVKDDWYKESGELSSKWLENSERFRAPEELVTKWIEMSANFTQIAEITYDDRRSKEATRLERNVADFRFKYMEGTLQQQENEKKKIDDRGKKRPLRIQRTPHKKLLPNTIATAIVTKFRVLPGDDVTEVILLQ
jgi:hypothetical protein